MLMFTTVSAQVNRALIVTIDKYPVGSGWAEIHATNDLLLVMPMLATRGFSERNITILTNDGATRSAIVAALKQLVEISGSGDHIYIHFSCHGQQMADDDGDEPDGLDEAIIPYDARRRFEQGVYEGGNHLRDDELKIYLDAIRAKAGTYGNVVLVVDACHSGTMDRDTDEMVYVRGTAYIFAPPGYIPLSSVGDNAVYGMETGKDMSPLTVIAACLPDQLNYEYHQPEEGKYYGSLTYALCGLMNGISAIEYDTLREGLESRLNELNTKRRRVQTPMLETSNEGQEFRIGR